MIEPPVRSASTLTPEQVAQVRTLVDEVTRADGVGPLSEHVMLHLPHGGDAGVQHLLVQDGAVLVGYAHLDTTDEVAGSSAELAVRPDARRHGVGRRLVASLLTATPDGRLRLWAHGEHPGAGALAAGLGFRSSRVLWQLTRSLQDPLPEPVLPPGVALRIFEVGRDEAAWTRLNNRAFAEHPDQGGWSVDEVRLREAEPWFDPGGFFLAERQGALVGFHWTKVHGGAGELSNGPADLSGHGHPPVGEVYIVGVDPNEQGRGLGPALTLVGLHHLRDLGLQSVMLYVDESNQAAVSVYQRLGFSWASTDVCWSR